MSVYALVTVKTTVCGHICMTVTNNYAKKIVEKSEHWEGLLTKD